MSTLRCNNITDTSGGSSSLSVPGAAKAWVNFNGTGTVAIRAQLNVSSITDNGTGNYTVNFTNALSDANYAVTTASGQSGTFLALNANDSNANTSSSARIFIRDGGGTYYDISMIHVAIFR